MNIDDETDDAADEAGNGHDFGSAMEQIDLFGAAIALCQVAQRAKAVEGALKRLRKIGRDTLVAERKLADIEARAADTAAALAEREAELDRRQAAIERRETELEVSLREAHDSLRQYHDNLAQQDRRIRYRILSSADLLHGYNERLQELPDWPAIKQMIPGLPPDIPATPPAEVVSENVREDWTGQHTFIAGTTLTRTVRSAV
jgi:hypothetical protein